MGFGKKKQDSVVSDISETPSHPDDPTPEVLALRAAIASMKDEVMRYRREAYQAKAQADQTRSDNIQMRALLKDMANAMDARSVLVATLESKCIHLEKEVEAAEKATEEAAKQAAEAVAKAAAASPAAPAPPPEPIKVVSSTLTPEAAQRIKALEAQVAQYEERLKALSDADARLTAAAQKEHRLVAEIEQLREELAATEEVAADLEEKYLKGEALRRQMHNTIMDLKGAIRVFCRVRPALEGPDATVTPAGEPVITFVGDESRALDLVAGQRYSFAFDKVFQPTHSQELVFEEISQLVQSAVDGFKVCIFAYGQTGSGKTHTMLGSTKARGMIPRSVDQIFNTVTEMEKDGWSFELTASMLEIYNEEYRDLLGPEPPAGQKMKVMHTDKGTSVSNMAVVDVKTPDTVSQLIDQAMAQRASSATAMNEHSSRSHMVFMLNINGYHEERGEETNGTLNLIDLAGSERLKSSLATGDRLKETQAINKSLSCLGDVIAALANKEAHVPYRNSKLTYLLQGSLGGSAKTLMFVNISPILDSAQESLCSLRFASKVNACELGKAKKQIKRSNSQPGSVDLTADTRVY